MERVRHLPTVKQLRYLVALAELKNFRRAAEACHVSQSAFSIAIQELESLLDVQLVDRTQRKVTITAVGQEVASQARLTLRDLQELVEIARGGAQPLTGPLRVGVIPTVAPFLLPRVLPKLRRQFPKLEVYLKEDITRRLHELLLAGELDLIIVALPYDLPSVETVELFRDAFRLACRADTKLIDPRHYAYNRLHAGSVLLLEDGHCLREHAISACRLRSQQKLARFTASSLHTLVQMVDADLGITYLPEMAEGSALLRGTHVKTFPLPDDPYRTIAAGWRQGSARAAEFRQLAAFIRDQR
jgi:LysR family hydrogen peroxide-inducible transcriptional activator